MLSLCEGSDLLLGMDRWALGRVVLVFFRMHDDFLPLVRNGHEGVVVRVCVLLDRQRHYQVVSNLCLEVGL